MPKMFTKMFSSSFKRVLVAHQQVAATISKCCIYVSSAQQLPRLNPNLSQVYFSIPFPTLTPSQSVFIYLFLWPYEK